MKILVIRFSSIGDIVLTSAVVRCLKLQVKNAEIHALTKLNYAQLYAKNPHISKVHLLSNSLSGTIKELKNEHFDYIVDLHTNLRSFRVRLALGVKSVGFPKLNVRKYLLVHFKWQVMPDVHVVDRYFGAVKQLGVTNDGLGLDFFTDESDRLQENEIPLSHRQGYYAFVIGGNHLTKILPPAKVIETISLLDKPVILLGGKEDMVRAQEIESSLPQKVWNLCGKISLGQSATLVKDAKGVFTNDTGLMHIAAAFNKPVVSIWGNTVPELGMYPYIPLHPGRVAIIEQNGLSCRPCSKIGYPKCPKGHFNCMNQHKATQLVSAMRGVIEM